MIKACLNFIKQDIWLIRKHALSPVRAFFVNLLRISILAFRGFNQDKCSLRASALTFYTLLSIVPVIAMLFGIARGFGIEKILEHQIREALYGNEEVAERILSFSNTLLENTHSGVIMGVGILALFWAVVKLLGNIEHSFNDIWGVKQSRSLGRKLTDYLSMLLICPIFLVTSSSITVLFTTTVQDVAKKIPFLGSPIITITLEIIPYVTLWILFSILYIFLTNTTVKLKSGIIGGIIAGTFFHIAQWGYVTFQVFTAKYNAIYGSFAALPLFLIWLQTSWLIVLFGSEISFANQNVDTYEFEPESLTVKFASKKLLALIIMKLSIDRFCNNDKALSEADISRELDAPIRLIRQIIFELVEIGLLVEIKTAHTKQHVYHPALNPDKLTIEYVISTYEQYGNEAIPITAPLKYQSITEYLNKFSDLIRQSPENLPLVKI